MTHWRDGRQPAVGGTPSDHRPMREVPRNSILPYETPLLPHGQITQALIDIFTSLFWIAFGLLFLCAVASIPLAVVLMMFF